MPRVAVLGEVAIDHLESDQRLGGASYAARAAAAAGVAVYLAGPLADDIAAAELEKLQRLNVELGPVVKGSAPRYVMQGTGPGQRRVTTPIAGTVTPSAADVPAEAYLILASAGLDLDAAVRNGQRHNALIALDGHEAEIRDPRSRPVLEAVDLLLLNAVDATAISPDLARLAETLGRTGKSTVVKHGRGGLTLFDHGRRIEIGAYPCAMNIKVGAGDTLAGATLARCLQGHDLEAALRYGSAAAALHIERGPTLYPPYVEEVMQRKAVYVAPERMALPIYLAAPFFTVGQLRALGSLERALEAAGLTYASPARDVGILSAGATELTRRSYFLNDIAALDAAPLLVALLDEDDPGTAWEVAYAYARNIPGIGLRTDIRAGLNNMLAQSVEVTDDLDDLLRRVFVRLA